MPVQQTSFSTQDYEVQFRPVNYWNNNFIELQSASSVIDIRFAPELFITHAHWLAELGQHQDQSL